MKLQEDYEKRQEQIMEQQKGIMQKIIKLKNQIEASDQATKQLRREKELLRLKMKDYYQNFMKKGIYSSENSIIDIVRLHIKLGHQIQAQDFPQILDQSSQEYVIGQANLANRIESMEARRQQLVREKQSSAQGPKSSQANEASLLNEEQMKSEIQKQLSQNQNTQIKKHVFILNERESYPSTEADMLNGQDTVAKPLRKVNRHVVSPEAFSFTQQIMNLVMEIEKARKSYSEQEQAETDRLYQIFCQKLQSTQNRAAFLERFTLILGMLFGTDKSKQIMQKFEVQSTIFFIQSKKIKAITQQSQKACGTSLLEQSAHKHTNSFTSAFPAAGMPSPKYNNSSYMSSSCRSRSTRTTKSRSRP